MEEKLGYVLSYYFNLYHADMLQRAIHDDSVSLQEFASGFKKICESENSTDDDEFTPAEFEKV